RGTAGALAAAHAGAALARAAATHAGAGVARATATHAGAARRGARCAGGSAGAARLLAPAATAAGAVAAHEDVVVARRAGQRREARQHEHSGEVLKFHGSWCAAPVFPSRKIAGLTRPRTKRRSAAARATPAPSDGTAPLVSAPDRRYR